MIKLLDSVFEFCASLKLAVLLILALAAQLAAATFYEAHYGAAAVQDRVYGSNLFLLTMALLAINVMAAALIRYPWKRKQTGFVITHLGIETLLLGCLISFRGSVDGRMALRGGDSATAISLRSEQLAVSFADGRQHVIPVSLWSEAGYPNLLQYVAKRGEIEPAWPKDKVLSQEFDDGTRIEILDWLPAAKLDRTYVQDLAGAPAVQLHVSGTTPMGQSVDQSLWLHDDNAEAAVESLFGGIIEASLWKARDDAEVTDFLNPPKPGELGKMGRLTVRIAGKSTRLDVDQCLGKTTAIDGPWSVAIDEYLPQAEMRGNELVKSGDEPDAPVLRVRLIGPAGTEKHLVSAKYPFLATRFDGSMIHAKAASDALLTYDHPAMYSSAVPLPSRERSGEGRAPSDSPASFTRGRLQLLQGQDGKLYARMFGKSGLKAAMPVEPGKPLPQWMSIAVDVTDHIPAARLREGYVPAHVAPGKMAEAMRAMKVALIVDGHRDEMWLARGAGARPVMTTRGAANLSYSYDGYPLPFNFTLLEASRTDDPGTSNAAAYESKVVVTDNSGRKIEKSITMNEPLTVNSLTFYQAGFDDRMGPSPVSFLSVRRDPGWPIKYAGCGLIVSGIFTMFYMKAYFQKPAPTPPAAQATTDSTGRIMTANRMRIVVLVLLTFVGLARALDVTSLRPLPILDNGRVKPIDTVARDTVRFVSGHEKIDGQEPLATVVDWAAHPGTWEHRTILYVPLIELRHKLGMPESEQLIEPARIRSDADFKKWTTDLEKQKEDADRTGEEARLSRLEEGALDLSHRLSVFDEATDLRLYCVTPAEGTTAWVPLFDVTGQSAPVKTAWDNLAAAWRNNDQGAFDSAAMGLISSLRSLGGANYANSGRIDREVLYNTIKPFRIAWIIYLLAVAGMVTALIVHNKWVYRVGFSIFLTAVVLHVSAFALRCSITGWAAVTNMYETVIWVALVAAVFALVLEAIYRRRTIAIAGATVALLATVIADVMPPEYGRAMRNLTPVLRSNYWLIIHVLTIVSSYAAFALAMVMGNITLAQYWAKSKAELIRENLNTTYRAIQIGVLLVAAGTILGGMWADVSWGRFWGWDPKEVWALIVLLTYLALLHGRFAGWIGPFGLAAGSILCWTTVIMSWYGVNFVLGVGLHAYGFGTGGQGYVAAYVLAQWIYVATVWLIVKRRNKVVSGAEYATALTSN